MSVEVCTALPEFRLTMVLIRPRRAAEHEGRAEEDGAQAADGAGGSVAAKRLTEEGRRDLAYVLHTSGTTGRPKIVRVPHKCILPNIVHLRSVFIAFTCCLDFLTRCWLSILARVLLPFNAAQQEKQQKRDSVCDTSFQICVFYSTK